LYHQSHTYQLKVVYSLLLSLFIPLPLSHTHSIMRLLLLFSFLFALCVLSLAVPVPSNVCSQKGAHLNITNVDSNEWPPHKGDTLNITISGILDKTESKGEYTVRIKVSGFPLPPETGDIGNFHPLPWQKGNLKFSFTSEIPSSSPSGTYSVEVSAVDQDNQQIWCVDLTFRLALEQMVASALRPAPRMKAMIDEAREHHTQRQRRHKTN